MRVTLIHNPGAGEDEHPDRGELRELLGGAGHEPEYYSSKGEGWEAALEAPCDLIAVAGGDGTIGKVARRVAGRGVPIAVLPLGTANNLSKTLGLTDRPLAELVAGWETARRVKFDACVAAGPWGVTRFIEGMGAGLFARTMSWLDARDNKDLAHAEEAEEKLAAARRILMERLRASTAKSLKVTLDGRDVSGDYLLLEAMNIEFVGPNLHLAPGADPGDGLLDVVFLAAADKEEMVRYLSGSLGGDPGPPWLTVRRGRHLLIEWDGFDVHIDDEAWPGEDSDVPAGPALIDVRVSRHALEFVVPV